MKKNIYRILLATGLLSFHVYKSQAETAEFQKNTFLTNSDTNIHTGVPNINLPLANISVAPDHLNIGVSLSYSTEGISSFKMISDVGRGWNLQYGGSIFRGTSIYDKDYIVESAYPAETISLVYNYSFLGNSGKFYIAKDEATGQLTAVHLQPSKNKIFLAKDANNPDKILSFTIIDDNGNTYLFDKVNTSYMKFVNMSGSSTSGQQKIYNSEFLLTQITNNKNQQMVSFEYETTTELVNQAVGSIQEHKIKKINVNNYGSINFFYLPNSEPHSLKNKGDIDWYQMDKLIVKDKNNNIISQYAFSRNGNYLDGLLSLDKDNNVLQKYSFNYTPDNGSGTDASGYVNGYIPCSLLGGVLMTPNITTLHTVASNSLKSITLPTGGRIEYEFESNSVAVDPAPCTSGNCYNYYDLDKIYTWTFDSSQSASSEVFNFPSGYQGDVFVVPSVSSYPPLHAPPPGVTYSLDIDLQGLNGQVIAYEPFVNANNSFNCASSIRVYKVPLEQINKGIVRGNIQGYGQVNFYATKQTRQHKNAFGSGLRIKSIKNYDAGSTTPAKWVQYEYNLFSDNSTSSGLTLQPDDLGEMAILGGNNDLAVIQYSNIKVTNMLDNSSTRYTYYDQNDLYNLLGTNNLLIDFSGYLKRGGLLKKQEVYGVNNNLLQQTDFSYEPELFPVNTVKYHGDAIKKVFIKKETKTVKDYISGSTQALTSSIENTYENQYNNLVYRKKTLYDGSIIEKNSKYALEKNVQKLLIANIVGVPLETEVKNNGKVITKAETRLDDPGTLYPTSALSYNINNQNSSKKVTFDSYDSKGNVREARSEYGIPTVTIWGYHQTQPIAKITGAKYADIANLSSVTAAVSASDADDNDPSGEPALILALDNVRKDDALKSYQIETYTYDPLIGITSKTAANGLRETYLYDSSHRISKVYDKEGKVIKAYDYHYSPQMFANDAMSGDFTANNCGAGHLPNHYTYLVPADKYFSDISKDEANQKAAQDIQLNGQNAANQQGGCRPVACTITKGYDIATLLSGSVTMPDASNFRIQMSFPYDSSISWLAEKSIGKIDNSCMIATEGLIVRTVTSGQWKITIYPNGNIRARRPSTTPIPNGTIITIDVTTPVEFIPDIP
ncbi:hypothetical protein QE422_003537 [Chryseobacterium sp. SORGH_AS 447]|uniref:DUF5977 domain-containing protein n=1 Tax=Chryseobacterium sp. SORGH_AS_0447 TaxID=3041769 RepID=UPI00277DC483|nr:DUF5977 domain-containing protein [Chryseobacterium sp. SORGH_AS_0447]MDQ1163169.1 hypothetical protein [Chryseobacterium sp. SORGH_AS_0447]